MTANDDLYKLRPPRWRERSLLRGARESATLALKASYQVDDRVPADMQDLLAQLSARPSD